jgi:tRNA pseudouridine55 synthase
MDEVLLIDKPKEWTSFDVVGKIRSDLRKKTGQKVKVGHAGTLDPLATGLLIVLIGKATKRQDEFMKQDKVYEVEAILGQASTTGDEEGEKTAVSTKKPSEKAIIKVLEQFKGEIQQVPPAYSAIKVNGQRAYKLARAGKEVTIEPRTVTIHSITDIQYNYPKLSFTTEVSSGTYIRSLVMDIGQQLGTGAYMSNLRRTRIGKFKLEKAPLPERAIAAL